MKFYCFKCQKIYDLEDVMSVALSGDNFVYMCESCIKVSGNGGHIGQNSPSPSITQKEVEKCHKEQ